MSLRTENMAAFRALFEPIRMAAVGAVQEGQKVIEDGMRRRVPVRTGKLKRSIHSTKVRSTKKRVFGFVTARARPGVYVEFGTRYMAEEEFVRSTQREDGQAAKQAMENVLTSAI